ncbi:MAG: YdcF family protein [Deltaproteobacteria bacterium]|nr:YdcF family protein [Deltaproteobacteria bacterium]MBW1909660.1 YdcF family protein [Deltaproteobacteria bacterium]
MKRRYNIALTVLILVVFAVVSLGLFIDPLLDAAGSFLVINDKPRKSDVIFVPAGESLRFIKAIKLLKAGFADRILINLEKSSTEVKAFERRYGTRFSGQARIEHIMKVEGLTPLEVIIPDQRSISTEDDFSILKGYLEREALNSVIVTTSWYHMRRCQLTARRILDKDTKTYFVPANLPDMNYFISRSKRMFGLFIAYMRLCYYYITI